MTASPVIPVLTAAESVAWDARARTDAGSPGRVLMESAGRAAAAVVARELAGALGRGAVEGLLEKISLPTGYATSIAMNLIVDQVWPNVAAGLPSRPSRGRPSQILFFVPWRGKTMIGTWHLPWNQAPDEFNITEAVIQDFIQEINSAHPSLALSPEKIHHVTWGFLPVNRKDAQQKPVRLTRDGIVLDHGSTDGVSGLISVLGVKYTTARAVAEKAVDLAVRRLSAKAKKCKTDTAPVHGGRIRDFKAFLTEALEKRPHGMEEGIVEHLAYTLDQGSRSAAPETH